MTRWIKRKDGRFAGSIGDGIRQVPLMLPPRENSVRQEEPVAEVDSLASKLAVMPIQVRRERFEDAFYDRDCVNIMDEQARFDALSRLAFWSTQVASTSEGQVVVLQASLDAAEQGDAERSHVLLDAAEEARLRRMGHDRTYRDVCSELISPDGNEYDEVLEQAQWFRRESEFGFNTQALAERVRRIAEHVGSAECEIEPSSLAGWPHPEKVYDKDVREFASRFGNVEEVAEDQSDSTRAHPLYEVFIRRVEACQRESQLLATVRAQRLLLLAQQVAARIK